MTLRRLLPSTIALALVGVCAPRGSGAEDGAGRIVGTVALADGTPVAAVTVRLVEAGVETVTDENGAFSFASVPSGSYELVFSLTGRIVSRAGVTVGEQGVARVAQVVGWVAAVAETLTVHGVSRQRERMTESPAAVTRVSEETIARQASHGQIPKLVEFTPGAQITQSGLYDFNLNTRGFNAPLNRRVSILLDGRQIVRPNLGAPSWTDVSLALDDLAEVEFIRGPSGALHGTNASSGVLNMISRSPRDSQGTLARLTLGELKTRSLDIRWAGSLGGGWYVKAMGGVRNTGDFSVSRVSSAEYSVPCERPGQTDCLPLEAVPLDPEDDDSLWFASARVDKSLGANGILTVEGGTSRFNGPVSVTVLSRTQVRDQDAPWARVNYSSPRWDAFAWYNEARGPAANLGSGRVNTGASIRQWQAEGQGNWSLAGDRVRFVAGGVYGYTRLPNRFLRPAEETRGAVFGQADWNVGERLRLVASGRVDDSTLYTPRFSPRAAAVFSPTPLHTLRLTFTRAWEQPTITQFLLFNDIRPAEDLSALQTTYCHPVPVDCGFGTPDDPTPVRQLAVGNEGLRLQENTALELGYRGLLGRNVIVNLDVYVSRHEDFISSILPQLGTPLGRINESFGPWLAPPGVPDPVRDVIRQEVPLLSNGPDGAPIIVARSYTNFGDVRSTGAEAGVRYFPSAAWALFFAYAWADYEVRDQVPGTEDLLRPNAPEHALAFGASYAAEKWNARLSGRWVDDFRWSAGVFVGDVPSYTSVDLQANYRFAERWRLSLNVANLLDDVHYEKFGGDLLSRRALVSLAYAW